MYKKLVSLLASKTKPMSSEESAEFIRKRHGTPRENASSDINALDDVGLAGLNQPDFSKLPHPNCYWVIPGKLMAGEYPGGPTTDTAMVKIGPLLDAGVNYYIDLTESHELVPYDLLMMEEAQKRGIEVVCLRHGYRDRSIPDNPALMVKILDAIDNAIAAGKTVYVHCWGGIGRTGSVIGCYLVRHGLTGEEALLKVGDLYKANMQKYHRRPESPENFEQCEFVRNWHERK